jgi:hypothetical protein
MQYSDARTVCRAVGRLRSALKPPSEVLPFAIQQVAQQKRLQAVSLAMASLASYIAAMRQAAAMCQPDAELLSSLLMVPNSDHPACALIATLQNAVLRCSAPGKPKSGKKAAAASEGRLMLNGNVFEELAHFSEPDAERLAAEIPLVSELIEAVLEHDQAGIVRYRSKCCSSVWH